MFFTDKEMCPRRERCLLMRKILAIAAIIIIVAFATSGTVAACTSQAAQNAGLDAQTSAAVGNIAEGTLDSAAQGWEAVGGAVVDWWNVSADMIIGYTTDALNNLANNVSNHFSGEEEQRENSEP